MTSDQFHRRLLVELSVTATATSIGLAAACESITECRDLQAFAERLAITTEARMCELEREQDAKLDDDPEAA